MSNVEIPKFGQHTTFSRETEQELVKHLVKLDDMGFGLTNKELRQLVYRFAFTNGIKHTFNNDLREAGKDWVRGFLNRHRNLSIRVSESLSYARARGMTKERVKIFYDHLSRLLDIHNLWDQPGKIFNCDETGLQLIYKPKKVISQRGKRDVVSQTTGEKGETVSVMACASASGQYLPPFVVMKGQRFQEHFAIGMPPATKIVLSDSGYMKWEQFAQFVDHFIAMKPSGPVILILDGHGSHCSDPPTIQKAMNNDIVLLCLPPHSTHKLQPLDVALFAPLKTYYYDACRMYVKRNPGKGINKAVFGGIFSEAWNRAATVGNAIAGFRSCGIFPFNPNKLPEHVFAPGIVHVQNDIPVEEVVQDVREVCTPPEVNDEVPTVTPGSLATPLKRSFEDISPIPSTSQTNSNSRKIGEARILTSPRFIARLKERKAAIASRKVGKGKEKANKPLISKRLTYDEDNTCKHCKNIYKEGENWVQCLECMNWFHVNCTENGNDPYFVCRNCLDDESD